MGDGDLVEQVAALDVANGHLLDALDALESAERALNGVDVGYGPFVAFRKYVAGLSAVASGIALQGPELRDDLAQVWESEDE